MRRTLQLATVMLLLFMPAMPANAAPFFYNFDVVFDDGALAGETVTGTVSVDDSDCPGGICDGVFTPGDPVRQLLSLDVTIDGIVFSTADDVDFSYGDFPEVGFANGFIVRIDLLTDDAAIPSCGSSSTISRPTLSSAMRAAISAGAG